jgi:hypothetical protein
MAQENQYLQLAQDDLSGAVKNAMQTAADKNPDVEAKLQKLALAANVPVEAARLDTATVERQVALDSIDYKTLAERYPSTAQLLADPANAALAKDDVPKLSALEDTLNFGINFGRSIGAALPAAHEGLYGALQAGAETAATVIDPLVGTILPQNPFDLMGYKFAGLRKQAAADTKRVEGDQSGMGFMQKSALSGAKSMGQSLIMTPLAVVTGQPEMMLYPMAATTGGQAYGEARDKGVPVGGALSYGTSQALIEYATEKLPAVTLLRDVGLKRSFAKTMMNQIAHEVPGEQVATILQDLNEWAVLNPEKPFSAYLQERPSAAAQTLIATIVATGGQTAIAKAADRATNGSREQRTVDLLTALKDGVMDSKTFERAPERVKDFIAKHTANGPMENIFIPAEQLNRYFQDMSIDPAIAAVEMGAKNFTEALATGGDVVIPLADFITSTAKTEHYDALLPDIRFTQGEMTQREAQLYEANHPEEVQRLADEARNFQPESETPALTQIQTDMTGQLVTGGMEQGTATSYAQLYAKTMTNLAQRANLDPLALHEKYGLQVTRPMADVLTQISRSDIQIDPLLDRLRSGDIPTGEDMHALRDDLDHLAKYLGGIGVDLASMSNDQIRDAMVSSVGNVYNQAGMPNASDIAGVGILNSNNARIMYQGGNNDETARSQLQADENLLTIGGGKPASGWSAATRIRGTDGQPAPVYRGAAVELSAEHFDVGSLGQSTGHPSSGLGVWFSASNDQAAQYGEVEEFRLDVRNPKEYSIEDFPAFDSLEDAHAFREQLKVAGFDGIVVDAREVGGPVNIVAFAPEQVVISGSGMQVDDTNTLSQDKRGYIQFGKDRKFNIALLEKADLSTFLHETGHFWLEVMGDLAADPTTSEQVKSDYAAILKFLNVESRDQIGVEQHELFARANEAYLREGKAPSSELRSIFQRFKAWLTMIYKTIEALDVTLTDEVRGVFDRIYASDAEIETAKDELHLPAMFATAADAGMTEQEFAVYSASVEASVERSKDTLRAKLMRQFAREKQAWWNAELEKVRAEVDDELNQQPQYQAFDALTKGELPDGTPFKLDKQSLIDQFGKEYVKRLPRGYGDGRGAVYSTDGDGLHHDAAADLLGYGSGSELIEALVNLRPRKALVEEEAKKRMIERHGDLMTDGTIADEAVAAMHNDERASILRTELLAIRKKQIEVAPFVKAEADKARAQRKQAIAATETPPASAFRDAARGLIGQTAIRDIRPHGYLLAERKAAKAAFAAMAKGDHMEAATQKQRELLNHYLYREATDALETADEIYTYARKFIKPRTRAKFGKAGGPYLEQIDDLLEQYEFADVPKGNLVRRENLLQFIRDRLADDEPVMIPDAVLLDAQRRNYKTLPFDQLLAVRDAIRNIEHLVDLKTRLLSVQAKRALEEVVDEGAASIAEFGTLKAAPIGTRTWIDSAKELRDGYFASHRKLASLFREMDGFKDDGFMWNTFMKPINEAANQKALRTEEATEKLAALYGKLAKPGLKNKVKGLGLMTRQHYPSLGRSMSKSDLLALALNYGNEGNRQRIQDGYGWTDQQVLAALNHLEANEWDFVQGMWDLIDSYWPEIAAQDKRVNGIEPVKVERSGFILPNGRKIEGGYYPIKYDERHSVRSYTDRAKEEADRILRGAVARPGVDTGFIKDRAGKVIDRKIKLDLGVGLAHIDTVLQTLTHREMLIDLNKILGASKMNGAILDHYGIEVYKAVQGAIVDIAAGEIGAQDAFESGMAWLRSGVTVSGLGLNLTTALMQPLGITQSMVRIGPKWVGRGIARFVGDAMHMENATKFVYERSDMMRLRTKTQNREINEIRNRITKGGLTPAVNEAYFYAITKLQAVVDIPTWLGAYEKYMEQTGNDEAKAIQLADQAVVDAQGGGQTKDLAGIQRGGPLKKMFTTFYSYFSSTWNTTVESAGRTDFKKVDDVGRFAVDMLLLYTVPVVLTGLLKQAVSGSGGPDDDEAWYVWLAKEQLSFMSGTLIGLREISSAVQGMYGYSGPAGTRFFAELSKTIKQVQQGEADAALAKASNNTAGILFHYPAGQLQRTTEGFLALKDGSTSNPLALIFGAPKKK